MAAQTEEEKASAAEAKRVEKAQAEEAETARLAAASVSAADATAKATAEAREQEQLKAKQEREEATEEDDGEFAGKAYSSENFSITTSTPNAGQSIEIRPAGWVGPGTFVAASRVKELKDLLGKVKNLPKE